MRQPRFTYPGAFHHCINRGDSGETFVAKREVNIETTAMTNRFIVPAGASRRLQDPIGELGDGLIFFLFEDLSAIVSPIRCLVSAIAGA